MVMRNCLSIVFVLVCMTTDLLHRRIRNEAVMAAAGVGLVLRSVTEGPEGAAAALAAAALTLVIFYPIWLLTGGKGIGAGDIKLLAALGVLLPTEALLPVVAVTFGSAAACGIVKLLAGKGGGMHLAVYAALGTLLHVGGLY